MMRNEINRVSANILSPFVFLLFSCLKKFSFGHFLLVNAFLSIAKSQHHIAKFESSRLIETSTN